MRDDKDTKWPGTQKAFSLMEVLVVTVVISILTLLAVPQYRAATMRSLEKSAVTNLRAIANAESNYRIVQGGYWVPAADIGVADVGLNKGINSTLKLAIIEDKILYTCLATAPNYRCKASYPRTGTALWEVAVEPANNAQPYCLTGTCPRCGAAPGGCPY